MTDLVDDYCAIAAEGADFADPRLAALRERMTDADVLRVQERLKAEAEDDLKEADELAEYGRRKFGKMN
jgi:hypothetical protein